MSRRSLFLCETKYQLFCILLGYKQFPNQPSDIVFTDSVDFGGIAKTLEDYPLFENIWLVQVRDSFGRLAATKPDIRKILSRNPEALFPTPFSNNRYTDFWIGIDNSIPKLYYYALTNLGNDLCIHFTEEGNASYLSCLRPKKNDFIDHAYFDGNSFFDRCSDIWLLNPNLFNPPNCSPRVDVHQISASSINDDEIGKVVRETLPPGAMPSEPVIYLDQCFAVDGYVTNDLEILKRIYSYSGDRLIVKRHPRNSSDRFSLHGIKQYFEENSFWETALLENHGSISDKLLVTIDSTAAYSAIKLLPQPPMMLFLDQLLWGTYSIASDKQRELFSDAITNLAREKNTEVLRPNTYDELDYMMTHCMNSLARSE